MTPPRDLVPQRSRHSRDLHAQSDTVAPTIQHVVFISPVPPLLCLYRYLIHVYSSVSYDTCEWINAPKQQFSIDPPSRRHPTVYISICTHWTPVALSRQPYRTSSLHVLGLVRALILKKKLLIALCVCTVCYSLCKRIKEFVMGAHPARARA